jgi:hypothetical protein
MSTTLSAEMHNASFVSRDLDDGRKHIAFVDPFTDEYLSPDRVPASIETQLHLREGLDYLRSRSNDLDLTIYAAPHGDCSVHDMRELMDTFAAHDVIFLEGVGHNAQQRDLIWDVSAGNKSTITDDEGRAFGPYGQRKLAALLRQNKPVYFADVPSDGGDFERAFIEWDGMLDTLKGMVDGGQGDSDSLGLAMGINLTATTIMREWYMLAAIGRELKQLDSVGYRSENPMFLVGALHGETLPHKASVLGLDTSVTVSTMRENGEQRTVDMPFDFVRAVGACAITTER